MEVGEDGVGVLKGVGGVDENIGGAGGGLESG